MLYYYSKEAYFHTTLFNYVMSGDIPLDHLRSLLTLPIVPNLTPFVDLFRFLSDPTGTYEGLVEYLIKYPIEFISPASSIDFTSANGKTASLLGNTISEYYNSPICPTSFDTSFYVNINNIGPETPDLAYIQASIATAYENILK